MYARDNLLAVDKCCCAERLCVSRLVRNMEAARRNDPSSNVRSRNNPEVRREEVLAIRNRFPTKIPIIVQRFAKETTLPPLDKSKFLVPQEITMSQFHTIIRNRMRLSPTQALYLLVNNRSMLSLSVTLNEAYSEHAGPDGFLHVTYASQEVFGQRYLSSLLPTDIVEKTFNFYLA